MQFVVLFRDAGMQYRALYAYNPDDEVANEVVVTKIHGTGPKQLSSKSMERFYKYAGFCIVVHQSVFLYYGVEIVLSQVSVHCTVSYTEPFYALNIVIYID